MPYVNMDKAMPARKNSPIPSPKETPQPAYKPKQGQKVADDEITSRQVRVAELRLSGMYQRDIAKELGVSLGTVNSDLKALTAIWKAEAKEIQAESIALDVARVERMFRALWERMLDGDVVAIREGRNLLERKAKYMQLDAPTQLHHAGEGGGPIQYDISLIEQVAREVAAETGTDADQLIRDSLDTLDLAAGKSRFRDNQS